MVGRTLDRYQLLEQVGQGGMAVVYRALDLPLNREVAVKVLHPHLAGNPESRARLEREAQAVARLRHENILEIFASSGAASADCYLVTEFIHGPTLRAFMNDHQAALELPEIGAMIACEIARALECAHQVGIIHRDIKPENVMIRDDGAVVLCDFGIAQVVDKERMTATGQLLGSPAYMSPEHIEGRPLDCRTDIFSLGVLLYQLTTSELPFRGRNPHETLKRISDGRFTPPEERAPLCPRGLSRVITRALSRDPAARYAQVGALHADLLAVLRESGVTDPRAELRAFFKDPEGFAAAFRPRLRRALIETGCRLSREGRTAAALAAWGRAQQLQPDDPEVAGLIRRVARRGHWRRAVAIVPLLAAAGVAIALYRPRPPAPVVVPAPVVPSPPVVVPAPAEAVPVIPSPRPPPSAPKTASLPSSERKTEDPLPEGEGRRTPIARVRPSPRPSPRSVRLLPWPKAVRVYLNGRFLGDYGTDVRTVELPEGDNEIRLENPACYSERVRIGRDESPQEIRLRLRWKPALLLVRTPHSADVLVEGRVGRSGQVIGIPLRTDDGKAQVEVQVSAPGRRTVSRTVEVRANQLTELEVALEEAG